MTPKPCKYPNKLKEFRKAKGLTQKEVALKLNLPMSEDRISHWEKGQMIPNALNLFKLASLFNVPSEEFYPALKLHQDFNEDLKDVQI